MKLSVRRGVFETNSSSVHACVILPIEDYKKWRDENIYVRPVKENDVIRYVLVSEDEAKKHLNEFVKDTEGATTDNYSQDEFDEWLDWNLNLTRYKRFGYNRYEEYYYDSDVTVFGTPSGDVMVVDSYFGYDG